MSIDVSTFVVNDLERQLGKLSRWTSSRSTGCSRAAIASQFHRQAEGDRPDEEFDVFEGQDETVVIPAGSYEWRRYSVEGTLAEKRRGQR